MPITEGLTMCFYNDGDSPEFFAERTVKSRKPHKCIECFKTIPAGESCKVIVGKWEGDFQTMRQCQRCVALIEAIAKVEVAAGCSSTESRPSYGGLFEEIQDWDHYVDGFKKLGLPIDLIPEHYRLLAENL